MFTVKDLFNKVSWNDVAECLVRLYPDQEESLPGYERVFEEICSCEPLPNNDGMVVCIELMEDNGERWYDVRGRVPGDDWRYALELCLFRKRAGFSINDEFWRWPGTVRSD